jgi:hypothetical protein
MTSFKQKIKKENDHAEFNGIKIPSKMEATWMLVPGHGSNSK